MSTKKNTQGVVRSFREKADLAVSNLVSDGGYLNPEQSNAFIRMLQEQPTLLNSIRTVPMNGPQRKIDKIGFGSRILRAAPSSGTALSSSDRVKPTTDQVSLSTKEVIAEVHLPYDVLEDNIERGRLEDTIVSMIAERASVDLEELLILADTGSGDSFLAQFNGLLAQATSHVVDYTAAPVMPTRDVFKAAKKAMPNKYLRNEAAMRYYVSPHADLEYSDSLASRETVLGDNKVQRSSANFAYGIQLEKAALMPNSKCILTFPKNIIWGVQRQIMIESDRDIRARTMIFVLTLRVDMKYEEEDAVVKVDGIRTEDTTTTTT